MKKIFKSVLIIIAGILMILSTTACSSSTENGRSEKLLVESGDYYKIYDSDFEETYEISSAQGTFSDDFSELTINFDNGNGTNPTTKTFAL